MADRSARRPLLSADELLLLALVLAAAALVWATRALIVPYPHMVPWYESSALFPRLMLILALLGGVTELLVRRFGAKPGTAGSEEFDSSAANLWQAGSVVALFAVYTLAIPWLGFATSTALFIVGTGLLLGLRLRELLLLALPLTLVMWLIFVQLLKVAFGHGWLF